MKNHLKIICLVLVTLAVLLGTTFDIDAAVRVKGYYRKDGTYVQPHYRSNPDSNPYNNWSFPGNINPYTGKVAPGDPDTYLKNYYQNKSVPSYIPTPITTPSIPSINSSCYKSSVYPDKYFGGGSWYYDNNCIIKYDPYSNPLCYKSDLYPDKYFKSPFWYYDNNCTIKYNPF